MRPFLQIALDVTTREKAIELAQKTRDFVDILEAGTPLIKAEGLGVVGELKRLFPDKKIAADMKTADTGALEARLAFGAGADLSTVLGCASLPTIESAILESRSWGGQIVVDLIGVEDKLSRVRELTELKPDYFGVHTGIDEQLRGKSPFQEIEELSAMGVPLLVAGGIDQRNLERLAGFCPAIIVVGGGITKSEHPEEAAKAIGDKICRLWPSENQK